MTPEEKKEVIYEAILKMVIWDEPKEAIFKKLFVNGFEGAEGEGMYRQARSERIASIRGDCAKKAGFGLLWFAGAAGLFSAFWYGVGGITRNVLMIVWVCAAIGAWKTIGGLVGIATAAYKRGSLADMD
ncbi:hypothetical protein [Roseimicrobium sp. ORNL1]|uniref:hypothetical protein n=1 Tax=Roseimicrobium sp. ORNL1 TaxID=2711231 RepID=UPI0013E19110|nr:hypothetical protein [Roseimicrobium sp. ORNL1]QIF04747.1 hypothetical protein G5S37_25605 [Roseimicrobium sp. ORNL1]